MSISTSFQIQRALVVILRANATLRAALPGGIHEEFAPAKSDYPLLTYQEIVAPYVYTWGSLMLIAVFDVRIFGSNSVDANNIDALVLATLDDASLAVNGQSTLFCRRVADLKSADVDGEGRKVYMVGGTYEIWTDQPHQ